MLKNRRALRVLCLLALAMLSSRLSWGHGALAIGMPDSAATHGFSIGFSWNIPTLDIARVDALRACLNLTTASARARGLCRVVTTFSRQCFSVATDHPGGGGWGWAVKSTIAEAEMSALSSCKSTVKQSCLIAASRCDTAP
jgi:hypothetical protein